MNKYFLILLIFFSISNSSCYGENIFSSPFIKSENNQKDANKLEPDYFYKPLIYIGIVNPNTRRTLIVSALIDTGSDHCYISKKLADELELKKLNDSSQTTYTASGSFETYAVEAEYVLADENRILVESFPIQKTHFYINEYYSQPIVLGFVGFIDRFSKVEFLYPDKMVFEW